jgi:apolipoprotein N-acyltransferase
MQSNQAELDALLWKKAKRRVIFKRWMWFYVLLVFGSWIYWYTNENKAEDGIPWPLFPTLFIAPIIIILYIRAYWLFGKSAVEKEYEKLKSQKP